MTNIDQEYICLKCKKKAQWTYCDGSSSYCDDCVPRGCSCGQVLKQDIEEKFDKDGLMVNPPEDYEDIKDEQGRLYPCVDYIWIGEEEDS